MNPTMTFIDQLNRPVSLPHFPPRRIISLVPSQTELLHFLGLDSEVIGITKFCVHPQNWFREKQRMGGTKKIHLDRIHELQPDLIIGNKEENEREQIEMLAGRYPVWLSDICTLEDAYHMISAVGALVDRENKAAQLVATLQNRFSALQQPGRRPKVAYFIWRNPYMVVGSDTFIHEMIQQAGYENAFADQLRYPEIELENLKQRAIDFIFLSSEPYPFKKKHYPEFKPFCQQAVIKIVDGELFSWYGSRLLHSAAYFKELKKALTLN